MQTNSIQWHDPRKLIWGFHVHQELELGEFSKALVVQQRCAEFLTRHKIFINAADSIKPGYGPHLNYMWELRVEQCGDHALEQLGLALSFMSINRYGLSAYIHPVMHDSSLPEIKALAAEGIYNQANALWFTKRINQKQDFFFNPPKDAANNLIDTRTSRLMSGEEKQQLYLHGQAELKENKVIDPYQAIINGFHLHMDFSTPETELALLIFDNFLKYLLDNGLRPTSTRIYAAKENGPHLQSGWEVKFETRDKQVLKDIGIAVGWLMCNRHGMSVFMHPVTWEEGDHRTELKAHEEYSMFIGTMPPLNLNFFRDKVVVDIKS